MPVRILITGSRSWSCIPLALRIVARIRDKLGADLVIVHGDCPTGVDRSFRLACEELGVEHEPHPADWDSVGDGVEVHHWTGRSYDPSAGPRRNQAMVDLGADYAIALHKSIAYSRGTRDCVRRCLDAGITVWLLDGTNETHKVKREELER